MSISLIQSTKIYISNNITEIMNPFTTNRTIYFTRSLHISSAGVPYQYIIAGYQDSATQFNGLKVFTVSGNISGSLYLYGYRK